ncbi:hypothetical protein WN944_008783 [Citrus x changshan-huyou]|uniref:Purple acid phosphatase n=1 Tax=Citrus x changshan-huyou TaxID=2935761 RepID=A0AAP0MR73_9ROSI
MAARWDSFVLAVAVVGLTMISSSSTAVSSFVRSSSLSPDMPLDSDVFRVPPGYNAPQQVHITQGDHEGKGVIVSWVTPDEPGSNTVLYWAENSTLKQQAHGIVLTYNYFNYTSNYIHHCTIEDLEFDTKYYYEVGVGNATRQFSFTTPPGVGPDVPYTFGLIDDYPFHDNNRWDTWGRFIERNAAYQPWIWTAGNHEIDFAPQLGEAIPFKPFANRFHLPYRASYSTAPFWYSIRRASAYIIVMSSYSAFRKYTPQYKWLEKKFPKVNRSETPWLIVLMHCPLYSSYVHHYMEGEPMRVLYEPWFVEYKVDVVFAGYERMSNIAYNVTNALCSPVSNQSAPVYIIIGDGGNQEGLAKEMTEPQPRYSAYREASFGHGILDVKNRTHAYFGWHRNQDDYAVEADSVWLHNRYWKPSGELPRAAI